MKLNLSNITSGYGAVAALNANFDAIEQAVENTLSRDGTTPNEMLANLDMNGNDILNADTINTSSLVINGTPVQPATGVTVASAFQSYTFTATAGQTSFSVSPFTPYVASVQVEVNGLSLPPADISVSGTNVVIPACSAGDEVVIRRYTDAPSPFPVASDITFQPAGTIQTRSVQSKLRDVVSVLDFGADPTGVADSTAAIQAAIDYVYSINGGTVLFPAGAFKVTSTINARSYVNLQGAYGEDDTFGVQGPPKIGTELRWAGANTTVPILRVFNVRLFQLDGMHFDGDNKNVTAILLDSNNNPSGSQNEFHRFSIRKCLVGVQWGTSGIAGGGYANDGTRFSTFTIWSQMTGSKGFVINSGNAGQMSVIESGGIQVDDIGIDIVVANMLQINRVFGGGVMDTAFIRFSVGIDVSIIGSASEAWGSGRTWRTNRPKFLKVIAPVETYPMLETTITLQQNQINNPIEVGHPIRIVSLGDTWGYCQDYVTAIFEPAKGNFTVPTSRCIAINNGVNPASIDLTTNEPAMGWIDSANVNLTNLDPGRGWVTPAYNSANFSASGVMTWTVQNTDVTTYAYTLADRTMTLSFTLNSTSVGGTLGSVLRVKIPNGKVATKAMANKVRLLDNGTPADAWCYTSVGGTWVDIQREDFANFAASTNATTIQGQITFEVN